MIPLKQRTLHRPKEGIWGDCHRACLASILHLTLDDVPHFGDGGPDGDEFNRRVDEWLLSQGLVQINVVFAGDMDAVLNSIGTLNRGVYYLLGGRSTTGVDHTVVCLNEVIVHDPSLNQSGIIGPCEDGWYWVTFLGTALAREGR